MRKNTLGLTFSAIAALLLTACGGGGGSGSSSSSSSGGAANLVPVASAGPNQTVTSGVTVTLNGTASADTDGTITGYTWTQTAGTPSVTLSSSSVAQPTFVAPTVAAAATLTFSLVVVDNRGASSAASTMTVTVNPATNALPVANAGTNQSVVSGVTVTLNGTASSDPDGAVTGYLWLQTAGTPTVTLSNTNIAQPTFVAPTVATAATLTFSLVVTDDRGAASAAPATVNVTVNPAAINVPPVANAGTNQTVVAGATVTLNGTASSDPDGSVTGYRWTQTAGAPTVTLSNSTIAQPTFVAPTVATAATLTFSLVVTDNRGADSAPATVNVTVNPAVAGNVTVSGQVTFARVPFFSNLNRGLNYASPVQQPARGVTVRAIDASLNAIPNATTTTDSQGNYTLSVPANTAMNIQVVAELVSTSTPRWNVRVQDGAITTYSPYRYAPDTGFNSGAGTTQNIAIPTGISATGTATGPRASGPFATLDTIYRGLQTIVAVSPTSDFPDLVVDWGSQSDGTFFTTGGGAQHIAILADLTEDTDEFDQHVIAHEFGHYIEENFSRADSIGGVHRLGDALDIRVAFGEGFGYAFAGIVLNDPVARDSYVDSTSGCGIMQCAGSFNVETNAPVGGTDLSCWCSESAVWTILWDLYDGVADPNDTVALGFAPLWNVLVGAQRTTPAFTSIFPFITALKTARPGDAAAIDTLIASQQITGAGIDAFGSTETHTVASVPANATLPLYTTIVLGTSLTVATSDNGGRHNRLGNHRYFRFTPTQARTVNISVISSNTSNPDPDFRVYLAGTMVLSAEAAPPQPEVGTLSVTANATYVLDVYDCANGCDTAQGTPGDYNLTVTIQ